MSQMNSELHGPLRPQTLGLCLFAVGVWLKMDFSEDRYREVVDPAFWLCRQVDDAFDFHIDVQMDSMAYFFIFLGVAIFGIGGIGACGTARERQTYLLMVKAGVHRKLVLGM